MLKSSVQGKDIQNLQIVIDNTTNDGAMEAEDEEMLEIDNNDENSFEAQVVTKDIKEDEDSTEFCVNLDSVPTGLQNASLSEKIYLNKCLQEEPNVPEDLNFINPENLNALYKSLDITEASFMNEEQIKAAANETIYDKELLGVASFRKEALHLFGVDELSTNEVFDYFKSFKPFAVEWINDSSCNVVWKNEIHAANAINGSSVEYNEDESESFLKNEPEMEDGEVESDKSKFAKRLPPQGCRWRKGIKSIKKHQIYMRFVRKTDRKVKGAEARSKYYVKFGNPNYGNMKGLLSASMRTKLRAKNVDIEQENESDRRPVIYDEGSGDLSDGEIEEFGTSGEKKTPINEEPIKLLSKSKIDFDKKSKMKMYSDELELQQQPLKRGLNDDENNSDNEFEPVQRRLTITKKTRYEPYSASPRSRNDVSLKSRLSGLRAEPKWEARGNNYQRNKSRSNNNHRSESASTFAYLSDDETDNLPTLKSTIHSVSNEKKDLHNRLGNR